MARALVFVVLALLAISCYASKDFRGLKGIQNLPKFQTLNGGFASVQTSDSSKASLEDTANGLFLASLYGIPVRTDDATKFLSGCQNGDFGFANTNGLASDLESVYNALLAYQHMSVDLTPEISANLVSFIETLYIEADNLFALKAGDIGSIKATAIAFQALETLGASQQQWVSPISASVKEFLQKSILDGNRFDNSDLSLNYYGIVLASLVGVDFGNTDKWISFIAGFQQVDVKLPHFGGFRSTEAAAVTAVTTDQAIVSLNILKQLDRFNGNKYTFYYLKHAEDFTNLRELSAAHHALSLTPVFYDIIKIEPDLILDSGEVASSTLIEGVQYRPVVRIVSFDTIIMGGQDVEVTATYSGSHASPYVHSTGLSWSPEHQVYICEEMLGTSGLLGTLVLEYTVRSNVASVGDVVLTRTDTRNVGYGIKVNPAITVAGKEVFQGDAVSIGSDFEFEIELYNQTVTRLQTDETALVMTVLDSADNTLTTAALSPPFYEDRLLFHYSLDEASIPAGALTFRFDVSNVAREEVHTSTSLTFNYVMPMVASKITFLGGGEGLPEATAGAQRSYKIGDKISVSMEPASLPDVRSTVHALDVALAKNMKFALDIVSPQGAILKSVAGVFRGGEGPTFVFSWTVEASLGEVGADWALAFRYVPAEGAAQALANYDSRRGELFGGDDDEARATHFGVAVKLQLAEVKKNTLTTSTNLHYGDDVEILFKVRDLLTQKFVAALAPRATAEASPRANVILSLVADSEVVARATAVVDSSDKFLYKILWTVNPNAPKGDSFFSLAAVSIDGVETVLEGVNGAPIRYDVKISGEITAQVVSSVQSARESAETAFVVQFNLFCNEKALLDANLRCAVSAGELALADVPVASFTDGTYQVSWTLENQAAHSGDYKVTVYQKGAAATDEAVAGKPLFEHSVAFRQEFGSGFAGFVKLQLVAVLGLGLLFAYLNVKKTAVLEGRSGGASGGSKRS